MFINHFVIIEAKTCFVERAGKFEHFLGFSVYFNDQKCWKSSLYEAINTSLIKKKKEQNGDNQVYCISMLASFGGNIPSLQWNINDKYEVLVEDEMHVLVKVILQMKVIFFIFRYCHEYLSDFE